MNIKFFYTFLALASLAFFLTNNSSGPALVQGIDRTGSPLSPGPCQTCHSAGNFSPTLSLDVLDGDSPIDTYQPGESYTLRVSVASEDMPGGYGFQAVALAGADNAQAGAFMNPPEGIQVTPLNGRQYAEHSTRSSSNVFEIEWQAPEQGTGEVSFYSAVVAANANFSSSGDGSVFLTSPVVLTEGTVSSTEENQLFDAFTAYPNPAVDEIFVNIRSAASGLYQFRLINLQGQTLLERHIEANPGEQVFSLNASELPAGLYTLQVTDGQRISSRKVVKR